MKLSEGLALLFVALVGCVEYSAAGEGSVDCRRFAFAPSCRGVASKRAIDDPTLDRVSLTGSDQTLPDTDDAAVDMVKSMETKRKMSEGFFPIYPKPDPRSPGLGYSLSQRREASLPVYFGRFKLRLNNYKL